MLTRQRYSSELIDDALSFAQRFPGLEFSTSVLRRLLTTLVRDNDGVFDMWQDGHRALLAVVSDVCENGAGSGGIAILGRRPDVDLGSIAGTVVGPALAYAKSGPRQLLDMQLPDALAGQAPCLEPLGFGLAYYTYSMQRPKGIALPTEAPLPSGWRWRNVDRDSVSLFHAASKQIFAGSAGTNISPLDEFAAMSLAAPEDYEMLMDGDSVAGIVKGERDGSRSEVVMLGRSPQYRGTGLGPRLLARVVSELIRRGAGVIDLWVEAENDSACVLYKRFGFELVQTLPTMRARLLGA